MAYATVEDMVTRFGLMALAQITDPNQLIHDEAVTQAHLEDASSEIDTILTGLNSSPVAHAPHFLLQACCDIAWYRLTNLRRQGETEVTRKGYKDILDRIRVNGSQLSLSSLLNSRLAQDSRSGMDDVTLQQYTGAGVRW